MLERFRTNVGKIIYILPALILFIIFVFYPLIMTFVQSFFVSNNLGQMLRFNGIQNYINLFKNPIYKQSIRNTLLYVAITVPFTVGIALLMAILVYEKQGKSSKFFSTIFSSTMGISVASAALFWSVIFHPSMGFLNKVITNLGGSSVGWLTDTNWALISVSMVTIWMSIGFSFIILLGGIRNIDRSYYESAYITGAGFWYRTRKITIPLLSPSIFFVITTSIIGGFQSFGIIDMLTRGGPINATNVMVYNIYKDAFVNFQYGYATAEGVILFLIILVISRVQSRLTERWVTYQ